MFAFSLRGCGIAVVALLMAASCGGDDGEPVASGACAGDARAETYSADMSKPTASGRFMVTLIAAEPGPPDKGDNSWRLRLADDAGDPLVGGEISVTPWMPDHGHGTAIRPVITDEGAGEYLVEPINLWMPGLWEVTLDVSANGLSDRVVFGFCIEG